MNSAPSKGGESTKGADPDGIAVGGAAGALSTGRGTLAVAVAALPDGREAAVSRGAPHPARRNPRVAAARTMPTTRATHAPGFHQGNQERGPRLRARPAIGRVGMAYANPDSHQWRTAPGNKLSARGQGVEELATGPAFCGPVLSSSSDVSMSGMLDNRAKTALSAGWYDNCSALGHADGNSPPRRPRPRRRHVAWAPRWHLSIHRDRPKRRDVSCRRSQRAYGDRRPSHLT